MENLSNSSRVMQSVEKSAFKSRLFDIRVFALRHCCVLSQCPGGSCYLGIIADRGNKACFKKKKDTFF